MLYWDLRVTTPEDGWQSNTGDQAADTIAEGLRE